MHARLRSLASPCSAERRTPAAERTRAQDPADNTLAPFTLAGWTPDPAVAAVLCGLDTSINYTKLSKAFNYLLRNDGCAFLVTNEDSTYRTLGMSPSTSDRTALICVTDHKYEMRQLHIFKQMVDKGAWCYRPYVPRS